MPRTVLLEKVTGALGVAYLYSYPEGTLSNPERPEPHPISATQWLIELDEEARGLGETETRVLGISYQPLDHPMWRQFDSTYPGQVGMTYSIEVQDAWGSDAVRESAANPHSVEDFSDSHMRLRGPIFAAADHHMRLMVDALLDGTLHPDEGMLGSEDNARAAWKELQERAEIAAARGPYVPNTAALNPNPPLFEGLL